VRNPKRYELRKKRIWIIFAADVEERLALSFRQTEILEIARSEGRVIVQRHAADDSP
jgi:hypothetical protein